MTIHAIKAPTKKDHVEMVFESLKRGEGRFGWSYEETADLRKLEKRIKQHGWDTLSDDEKECWHPFLLEFQDGDYVVIINAPEWGKCTLAKVTGEYQWRWEQGDFNHRFPVDPESVQTFDRNDAMVHPALSARLKLQGRWWTIYAEKEFRRLLESLPDEMEPAPRGGKDNLAYLSKEIQEPLSDIAGRIHHTHPNKDLECLVGEVFKQVPGVKNGDEKKGARRSWC